MIWLIAFAVFWLSCGVLAYGICYGDFYGCGSFPLFERSSRIIAAFMFVLGPFGLINAFILSGFCEHGLMYRNPHRLSAKQLAKRIESGEQWEPNK